MGGFGEGSRRPVMVGSRSLRDLFGWGCWLRSGKFLEEK